jgi:hypothetical protein
LPNEISRVTYLLAGIEYMHAPLQAAMALVRADQDATGKMHDFEATASFDPVTTKRIGSNRKRTAADISEVDFERQTDEVTKARVGKTSVEYRFHAKQEQRKELNEYRDACEAKGLSRKLPKLKGSGKSKSPGRNGNDDRKPGNKKMKTTIAAAVPAQLKTTNAKAETDASVDKQLHDYIASLIDSAKKPGKKIAIAEAAACRASSCLTSRYPLSNQEMKCSGDTRKEYTNFSTGACILITNAHVASIIITSLGDD